MGGYREQEWSAIREFYNAGNSLQACKDRFGVSDWDWHAAVGRGDVTPRTNGDPAPSSRKRAMVAQLRAAGLSYTAIGRRLGMSKATVAYHARRLGVPANDKCARRYDWAEVQAAVDSGMTMRQCMAKFGFSRDAWGKAVKRGALLPRPRMMPIEELLVVGRRTGRSHLKTRLLNEGFKQSRCEQCGISEWRGAPMSMHLHHINGDGTDNRLENIVFLCPNCHSQTDTYGGRNGHRKPGTAVATA